MKDYRFPFECNLNIKKFVWLQFFIINLFLYCFFDVFVVNYYNYLYVKFQMKIKF